MQRIFIKKYFLFTVGSVSQLGGSCFTDDKKFETEVRKWQRQQSKRHMLQVLTHW
jgi:hypothetical protein